MNIISVILGIVSLIITIIGLFPLLGWLNWISLIICIIGIVIGIFCEKKTGRNLNLVVLIIAIFRLLIGGGIF